MGNGPGAGGRMRAVGALFAGVAGLAVGVSASAAWIPVRTEAPSVDAALALVAVTTLVGLSGRRSAIVGSAAGSAAGFSYFDTEPYQRWAITHGSDVLTAVLLVVVGLAAGELAVRVGGQRRRRTVGDQRLERIREAATRLAQGEELVAMIGSVAEQIQATLHLSGCEFSTEDDDALLPAFDRRGTLGGVRLVAGPGPGSGAGLRSAPGRTGSRAAGLPVLSQGVVVGRFVLHPGPLTTWATDQVLVAVTLADQVGAALAAQAPPIGTQPLAPAGGAGGADSAVGAPDADTGKVDRPALRVVR